MEVECFKIQLKPDALPLVREWASRLNSELSELESVFLEEGNESSSLIYYLRSPNLEKARDTSKASTHPLDVYHQDIMKKIALKGTKLECLLDASSE